MSPKLTPEHLPNDINSAPPGRFAAVNKRFADRAKADMPTDAQAKPDNLLRRGVFVPDTKK